METNSDVRRVTSEVRFGCCPVCAEVLDGYGKCQGCAEARGWGSGPLCMLCGRVERPGAWMTDELFCCFECSE